MKQAKLDIVITRSIERRLVELSLAKQLIKGKTSKLIISAYKDDYEAAVKKLLEAKRKEKPLTAPEPKVKKPKVFNIMDALRSSVSQEKKAKKSRRVEPRPPKATV